MEQGGSLAKINRPVLVGVYARRRLLGLLDELGKHRVIWVMGPPGAGKTTAVTSYIASRRLKGIWYQVDGGDSDPATFFYYLGLAAKQAHPRIRRPLPILTPEYLPGLSIFSRRYFEELARRFSSRFVMVLDNYQEVASNLAFHEVMCEGLAAIPSEGSAILISRESPPCAFSRLQANGELAVVGWEELRFTEEETRGMIALRSRGKVSEELIRLLQEETDGWVAGIILMLEWTKLKGEGLEALKGQITEAVLDYFAGEVFGKLKPEDQEVLLRTAHLPRMTVRMAQRLTGMRSVESILTDLSRAHFFVQEHPGPERVYTYHALFREFLLSRAKQRFSDAQILQMRHRSAVVLEEAGQVEDAVELFASAGDWAAVERIILEQAPGLAAQGRFQTLEGWIGRLLKDPAQGPSLDGLCVLAEKAFSLYSGPFLYEESESPWALSRRERLQTRMVTPLQELGASCEQAKDWERAVACYQKGLGIDPLVEHFYQRLMLSYQRLGRRAEALSTYRRCRETLTRHFQIPPSSATEALYQQIRAGH
jgi:ATP/maltotriose-dependent transcriptional regulator MalT